jgi:hypothetical protein
MMNQRTSSVDSIRMNRDYPVQNAAKPPSALFANAQDPRRTLTPSSSTPEQGRNRGILERAEPCGCVFATHLWFPDFISEQVADDEGARHLD